MGLGSLLGGLAALIVFAPAAWVASGLATATSQRLLLADARGTVWRGDAMLVLSGGEGSRAALALPGRLSWQLRWRGTSFELQAQQACCLNDSFRVQLEPGLGRMKLSVLPVQGALGQWPMAWLAGLGAPWNTLQLGGVLRLHSTGLTLESAQGRHSFAGHAQWVVEGLNSRLSTVPVLGSYTLDVDGPPTPGNNTGISTTSSPVVSANSANSGASLVLATQQGPLLLSGTGHYGGAPGKTNNALHFRGEARATPEAENALNNLLNVIGRRQGALSILSIG